MQQRRRWATGAAVGIAALAATAVGIRQATKPKALASVPAARSSAPFSGVRTQPWTVTSPGNYVFNPGTTVKISPADSARGVNAVTIKASGVTIENLNVQGGYRGFSAQKQRNLTFRNCTATQCGIPTSGNKHGGSNWICIDCSGVLLVACQSTNPAGEHCYYGAQGATGHSFSNCLFADTGSHANPSFQGVWQFNSESGTQSTNISAAGCTFRASLQVDCIAVMGGGTPSAPVLIANSNVTGGRRGVMATNFAAGRNSYILLKNTSVVGSKTPIVQQGGSWVRKQQ
jgi:hypothetical protein